MKSENVKMKVIIYLELIVFFSLIVIITYLNITITVLLFFRAHTTAIPIMINFLGWWIVYKIYKYIENLEKLRGELNE